MNGHGKLNSSVGNTPFRRVKDEEIEIDERVKNNSFEAKVSLQFNIVVMVIFKWVEDCYNLR